MIKSVNDAMATTTIIKNMMELVLITHSNEDYIEQDDDLISVYSLQLL